MLSPHLARYSFLFRIDYRTRSKLGTRTLYIVAASPGEAAHAALEKAHTWRGVVRVDRAVQLGSAIQVSG
jgi:hypothetical protein